MQHSWCDALMVFTDAKTVIIDEKEVKSIVLQDGGVLYEKENIVAEPLILHFTGQQFTGRYPYPLVGNNIIIDWGDGTTTNYDGESVPQHTYNENAEYIITISGLTELSRSFSGISGITDIIIPNTITAITIEALLETQISNVVIPSSVITLGDAVFNSTPLSNIVLSEGLKTIGSACFSECNLSKIIIPYSVTSMGYTIFGGTFIKDICLLWDSSETIISYQATTYQGAYSNDYTFNIPEGTTQLYVDKGYPLERLVEGATSITLTSNKDIVKVGETAVITGTLNYPSQDGVVTFNTKTPESVTIFPGNNYYSLGENGLDITDFTNDFYLTSNTDNGFHFYISYYAGNYGPKALNVSIIEKDVRAFPPIINKITYPIRLHIDENNIIAYRYKDYEQQEVICLVKNLPSYMSRYHVEYTKEEGFTQWQLSGENSLTVTKNTGLSTLTDSNGQATMEYEGVGAGNVTITGTYLDKDVSDSITINDTSALYLTSNKESIKRDETAILTTSLLPKKANETVYINKIINDENLVLELTSTRNRTDYTIKAKVIDEDDNGLENIRIKLYKEE